MNVSEPRTGIHSIRICDVAIIDVILTFVAAVVISPNNILSTFVVLILLSIIVHTVLGIKTKTNWIFFDDDCS